MDPFLSGVRLQHVAEVETLVLWKELKYLCLIYCSGAILIFFFSYVLLAGTL